MQRQGFTLIEVLVTCSLLLLLAGSVFLIWMACRPALTKTDSRLTLQNDVREALIRVSQCLRTANAPDETPVVIVPATNAAADRLEFYSCDVLAGPDRPLDPRDPERFRYRVAPRANGELWLEMFQEDGTGSPLADRRLAQNVQMTYANQDDVALKMVANATTRWQDVKGFWHDDLWQLDTVVSVPYSD